MNQLSASEVVAPLYNFTQLMVGNRTPNRNITKETQEWIFTRLSTTPLSIKDALGLTPSQQSALYELLSQYIIFLTINSHLMFPRDFLVGTSEVVLGKPLLAYIQEHRWPFPQMLVQ
ncbi:hypothetical protein [Pseudaeromonas pectinilytica]